MIIKSYKKLKNTKDISWLFEMYEKGVTYYEFVTLRGTDLYIDGFTDIDYRKNDTLDMIEKRLRDDGQIFLEENDEGCTEDYSCERMGYEIYRLPLSAEIRHNVDKFKPYSFVYVPIWTGVVSDLGLRYEDDVHLCEQLSLIFNKKPPKHYTGQGLSYGDIVAVYSWNQNNYWARAYLYTETGFKDVSRGFFSKKLFTELEEN